MKGSFFGWFAVVVSIVRGKMIPIFVHTVFMIELVHFVDVDKDKNDETKNGPLLRHPETKFETKKMKVIQKIDKQNGHSKRNQKPNH